MKISTHLPHYRTTTPRFAMPMAGPVPVESVHWSSEQVVLITTTQAEREAVNLLLPGGQQFLPTAEPVWKDLLPGIREITGNTFPGS